MKITNPDTIIKHHGTVVRIDNERVWVHIEQTSACSGCHAASVCGAADKEEKVIEAVTRETNLNIGAAVVVETYRKTAYTAVIGSYVLPSVLVITIMALLTDLHVSEAIAGISSLGVLLPYYGILYIMRNKLKKQFVFTARSIQRGL